MALPTTKELIFYTGSLPVREMLSSVDPSGVQFVLLDNLSIGKRKVTARWGCDRIALAPEPNASFRGSWSGYIDGNYVVLAAFRVGSDTKIYTLTSAGTVWTEISSASAASARFSTDGWVQFGAGSDPGYNCSEHFFPSDSGQFTGAKRDIVVCGNGTDEPGVVYYSSGFAFARVADVLHATTPLTSAVEKIAQGFYYVATGAYRTYTNSGANLTMADTGADPNIRILLTFNAAAAVADTSIVNFETGSGYEWGYSAGTKPDFTYANQLHFLVEDTISDPVFDYLLVEAYDSAAASYKTVYDASSVSSSKPIYTPADSGVYLASLPVADKTAVDVSRFRFTVKKKVSANRTVNIVCIMVGGMVPGDALYRASILDINTRVESRAIAPTVSGAPMPGVFGGQRDNTTRIPQPPGTYWANFFGVAGSSSTDYKELLYRKDPEDEDFFLCSVLGSSSGATHCAESDKDYARKAPSEYTVRPPKAAAWLGNNNRIFAGNISGDNGKVMASVDGYGTRFESLSRDSDGDGAIDDDAGSNCNFAGEQVKRLAALPGSLVGIAPVAVFTNKNVWRIEGIDALSLARPTLLTPRGTLYPFSIASHKGNIYFLDSEKQPCVLMGGMDAVPLGIWRVEDQFTDNVVTNCAGVVYKEAYKLAIAQSGETLNQYVLNYEERLDGWHRHTYANPDWAAFIVDEVSQTAGSRLLGITSTGAVFVVEKETQTADEQMTGASTDAISITLKTGEITGELWRYVFIGRVGLIAEKATGKTLTVTRADLSNSTNDGATTGTIDCSTGVNDRVVRWDQESTSPYKPAGITCPSGQITVSGEWIPGKYIKALWYERGVVDKGPDVAA